MTIHATFSPIGSTSPKDLIDNAQNLDYLILGPLLSYPDRRGVNRLSWAGIEASFAADQAQRNAEHNSDQTRRESEFDADQSRRESEFYSAQLDRSDRFDAFIESSGYDVIGDYASQPVTFTERNQLMLKDGELWKPRASVALPYVTTGVWASESPGFVSVGDAALRQEIPKQFIRRSEISADASFAYKKKVFPFPYRHPQYAEAVTRYGSLYSQAFCIDIPADEILFVSASGAVTVFSWNTRAYKKTYNTAPAYVSESAIVKYVAGTRLLYLRGNGTLLAFDITTTTQWQDLAPSQTIAVNAQRNFAEYAGEWVIALDNVNPIGFFRSRGYFGIYNSTFGRTGNVYLSPLQCGIQEGTPHEGTISKMQGMSFDGKTIYLGMGGYWNSASANKAYGAYGVRTFTRDGQVTGDYLLDPAKFISKLTSLGYHPDHCENEGVQFVQETNNLYTLMVGLQDSSDPALASSEGLYVMQEFCTDHDAIDFSDCATSISTIDEIHRDGGVLFPRTGPTGLVNPLTGASFTSWVDIVDYMKSVDMSAFMYYSSNVTITDFNGVALPSGLLVTIKNTNNSTFLVVAFNPDVTRTFRLVGGVQAEAQSKPTMSFLPTTTKTLALGSSALEWSDVRSVLGTFTGPIKIGQYTLATLPSAATYNGCLIIVNDAVGGAKFCRSNGTVWQIANTTTTVS